jgi:hypothetical protein
MGTEQHARRRYASLDDALRSKDYPEENFEFIRQFTAHIGIEAYLETSGYIKAIRRDGGEPLRIYYGGTNGFASEEEVLAACGHARHGMSQERPGLWRVDHPDAGPDNIGPSGRKVPQKDHGTCPVCFTKFTAAGTCACVD